MSPFLRTAPTVLDALNRKVKSGRLKSSMGVNGQPGASLRMWKDYFPNASIFGCDIDRDVLFSEERIKTFHCDQTSAKSISNFLKNAISGISLVA